MHNPDFESFPEFAKDRRRFKYIIQTQCLLILVHFTQLYFLNITRICSGSVFIHSQGFLPSQVETLIVCF